MCTARPPARYVWSDSDSAPLATAKLTPGRRSREEGFDDRAVDAVTFEAMVDPEVVQQIRWLRAHGWGREAHRPRAGPRAQYSEAVRPGRRRRLGAGTPGRTCARRGPTRPC